MKAKRLSKAKRLLSLDRITTLPQPIIETILCLLPIEEAARTSILSKEWRYKWTSIPTLKFDQYINMMGVKRRKRCMTIKLLSAILRVLLLRQDPIHEFALSLYDWYKDDYTQTDIDIILLQLSRNHTIKSLTLDLTESSHFTFPLFICNGFGSLTSLSLDHVNIQGKTLLELLSNCPLLKSLSLSLTDDNLLGHEPPTVKLFEYIPVIEHLTVLGDTIRFLVYDLVLQQFPTSLLVHLNYIRLEDATFVDGKELTCLAVLIKCSPNLEKIEIAFEDFEEEEIETDILEEYSDVRLEHLLEVKLTRYKHMKAEFEFVKFILARSPKLKKMSIGSVINKDAQPEILHTLRALPVVEINPELYR